MHHPITIDSLLMLDAIERRGSFAKAAEEMNKATSALSYGIQKLEEQLGVTLFERQGRRSVLTSAGRLILDDGRKIITATEQLADRAKEVATGWEPKIRIALESTENHPKFFKALNTFLQNHSNIEIDIIESVLSGAWEVLENGRVDLLVGATGPVPLQKGYRAISLGLDDFVPVIAAHHPFAEWLGDSERVKSSISQIRRVVTHDTATVNIQRSEGFNHGHQRLFVQTIGQKVQAILAGLGVGHLPRQLIQSYLDKKLLLILPIDVSHQSSFIAWKITNKGRGLKALTENLAMVMQ